MLPRAIIAWHAPFDDFVSLCNGRAGGMCACERRAASRTTQVAPAPAPAAATVTSARPSASALRQQWLEMFARGYFPGRSGQVFLVPREGDIITSRDPLYPFMHGSPWDYDTRIPILFYGAPFVRQGQSAEAAKQQDVAPTLGAIIGAPTIATYTGRVLPGVTARRRRTAARGRRSWSSTRCGPNTSTNTRP